MSRSGEIRVSVVISAGPCPDHAQRARAHTRNGKGPGPHTVPTGSASWHDGHGGHGPRQPPCEQPREKRGHARPRHD